MVAALTGRAADARATAEAGLAASRTAGEVTFAAHNLAVLGFIELSAGNLVEADSHLRELPDLYARMGYGNVGVNPYLPNAIETAVGLGELARAERLLAHLEGAAGGNPLARAAALRCRGLLAAARRQPETAITTLEQAAHAHDRSQDPFERARTLLALGAALRRSGRRRAARDRLQRADDIFTRLGAPLWQKRASRELAAVSGRPPRTTELTMTERRVAELVARGATNREVAARLMVSERTVATHLTHIYGKLGVRSRTELARTLPASGPKIRAFDDAARPGASYLADRGKACAVMGRAGQIRSPRLLRAIMVPGDEIFLTLWRAPDADAVDTAAREVGLDPDRVVPAEELLPGPERMEPGRV
jgi:DNA-binding CsgD family transcriptional regulator